MAGTSTTRREVWTSLHLPGRLAMTERIRRQRSTRGSRVTLLGDDGLRYFNEGTYHRLYEKFGVYPITAGRTKGIYFMV
jgi:hypothetical protein